MKNLFLVVSLLLTNSIVLGQIILTQETFNEAANSVNGTMTGGQPWSVTSVNSCSGPFTFSVQTFSGINRAFKEAGATGFGCCYCVSGIPDPMGTCGDVSNF
ncbi:MAG: hypothetical protein IPI15_01350 [Saprospiraceae bacterium]|uniref:hypothetical protein n=1 Tax=Candidatus Brachybacter algidus TaxID=2982024 RepID=UPI00257B9072|nr:hypothetical protein [Candidatus Brachybacter algidus]MBK7602231.1 hypothetical protein [Candidatus Brachybacter algidus]